MREWALGGRSSSRSCHSSPLAAKKLCMLVDLAAQVSRHATPGKRYGQRKARQRLAPFNCRRHVGGVRSEVTYKKATSITIPTLPLHLAAQVDCGMEGVEWAQAHSEATIIL